MRILRSLHRRGFDVGSAGYFSVLRQNTWVAASRVTDGFESLIGRSNRGVPSHPADQQSQGTFRAQGVTAAPPALGLISYPRRPYRTAAIVCVAIALTFALLWWIGNPGWPTHF